MNRLFRFFLVVLLAVPFGAHADTESVALVTGTNRGIGLADTYFYRMSKAALNMGMRVMQNEVAAKGISIGILSPGIVATDARTGRDNGPPPPDLLTPEHSAKALMKRIGEMIPQNAGRYLEYTNEELPW